MVEYKRMEKLLVIVKEKADSADRLFDASKTMYIHLRDTLDRELTELEKIIKMGPVK